MSVAPPSAIYVTWKCAAGPSRAPPGLPGDAVQFQGVRMHKGIFVTAMSPKKVQAVKEANGQARYDVQFLDAEGNPHVIENVPEGEIEKG